MLTEDCQGLAVVPDAFVKSTREFAQNAQVVQGSGDVEVGGAEVFSCQLQRLLEERPRFVVASAHAQDWAELIKRKEIQAQSLEVSPVSRHGCHSTARDALGADIIRPLNQRVYPLVQVHQIGGARALVQSRLHHVFAAPKV